jgi:hypothetical protein
MSGDPDYVEGGGNALLGTGCPICGCAIEQYEVRYVYTDWVSGDLDRDANRWVLHPCEHEMTRSAWDVVSR